MHPCSNCSSRGLGSSCTYSSSRPVLSGRPPGSVQVQERINQLENLVLSLMQQTTSSPMVALSEMPSTTTDGDPVFVSSSPSGTDPERPLAKRLVIQHEVSPSPSDYGSIRIHDSGVSYVSSAHWEAVLDSIAELRNHLSGEGEADERSFEPVQVQSSHPSPQLLYSCSTHVTLASILESMPPRSVVDRMVSRYFNDLDMATGKRPISIDPSKRSRNCSLLTSSRHGTHWQISPRGISIPVDFLLPSLSGYCSYHWD